MHDALLDNLDTPRAMEALAGLIRNVNVYLAARQGGSAAAEPNPLLLQQAAGGQAAGAGSSLSLAVPDTTPS